MVHINPSAFMPFYSALFRPIRSHTNFSSSASINPGKPMPQEPIWKTALSAHAQVIVTTSFLHMLPSFLRVPTCFAQRYF